jgi:hypothetical protein
VWENFMKIIACFHESQHQILGDDRRASICPSPVKQTTPFKHVPSVHETFPMHFDKLAMDFGKAMIFAAKHRITKRQPN